MVDIGLAGMTNDCYVLTGKAGMYTCQDQDQVALAQYVNMVFVSVVYESVNCVPIDITSDRELMHTGFMNLCYRGKR